MPRKPLRPPRNEQTEWIRELLLGAHLSIAGGVPKAPIRARALHCNVLQIFVRSPARWQARPIERAEVAAFRSNARMVGLRVVLAHAPYLINLASPEPEIRDRSIRTLVEDMKRCAALGIGYLVVHPGSHRGEGEEKGLRKISSALVRVFSLYEGPPVSILLENTAGQGDQLGRRVGDLGRIMSISDLGISKLGICLDTCHAFGAGYDLRTSDGYTRMIDEASQTWGVEAIKAFHLNDSKGHLGSGIDRHEHIGEGHLGHRPFRRILQDQRFADTPKIIETPKEQDGIEWDQENLDRLRVLSKEPRRPSDKSSRFDAGSAARNTRITRPR